MSHRPVRKAGPWCAVDCPSCRGSRIGDGLPRRPGRSFMVKLSTSLVAIPATFVGRTYQMNAIGRSTWKGFWKQARGTMFRTHSPVGSRVL